MKKTESQKKMEAEDEKIDDKIVECVKKSCFEIKEEHENHTKKFEKEKEKDCGKRQNNGNYFRCIGPSYPEYLERSRKKLLGCTQRKCKKYLDLSSKHARIYLNKYAKKGGNTKKKKSRN